MLLFESIGYVKLFEEGAMVVVRIGVESTRLLEKRSFGTK